jgi:hypothetical protein
MSQKVTQSRTGRNLFRGEEQVVPLFRLRKKWVAATLGVAVIGTFAAVALGSLPSPNFVGTPLVTANFDNKVELNSDRVKFQTKGPTDVRVQKVVIGANGNSGWHHHPGFVLVSVASGAVTFMQSDCSSKTYGPGLPDGSVFVEYGDGAGLATAGVDGATLYTTYVAPDANPPVFRIEDDPPACAG